MAIQDTVEEKDLLIIVILFSILWNPSFDIKKTVLRRQVI